ncbi:MAG: hypothetical protein ACXVYL_16860 [Oryzihumus sp.]
MSGPVYLHVGLPKTGTTFLQSLLADNRPILREAGVLYPFVPPEGMFHGAVEIRDQYDVWGIDPEVVRGTWRALSDKINAFDGIGIISHEILGAASPAEVRAAAAPFEGRELHVVVTARDPSRQVAAHWQEQVKNGRTYAFAELADEVFGARDRRGVGDFWGEQDLLDTLDRWGQVVPADRVHVVVCPPPDAPRGVLWQRFAEAVGIEPGLLDPTEITPTNTSLGTPQVALLRAINAELGGRLQQPHYAHRVKRYFAQRVLADASAGQQRIVVPSELHGFLTDLAGQWVDALASSGHRVHGDLAHLIPAPPEPSAPHPDDVSEDAAPAVFVTMLARMLLEMRQPAGDSSVVVARQARPPLTGRLRGLVGRRGDRT